MYLKRVTPPDSMAVDRAEVWAHLRLDADAEPFDASLIDGYIEAAVSHVDGEDGWLGRALITQTWDLILDGFPDAITVPLPPLQSVVSLSYTDVDGNEQTLSEGDDFVVVSGDWKPGRITPAHGKSWPAARGMEGAVTLQFTAGYGDDPGNVPAAIRQALLLLVGHFYSNREEVVIGTTTSQLPIAAQHLLYPFRTQGAYF